MASLSYYADYVFKFLFIASKGKALIHDAKHGKQLLKGYLPTIIRKAQHAKRIYNLQIRRAVGLNFFASWIPGTQAFTARIDYFQSLLQLHEIIEKKDGFKLSLTPFYFLKQFFNGLKFERPPITEISGNYRSVFFYLPLLHEMRESNGITQFFREMIHSLLNPVRFISSLLSFYHHFVALICDARAWDARDPKYGFRVLLKSMAATVFVPLQFCVKFVEATVDLAYKLLRNVLLEPLILVYKSINQTYFFSDKEILYVPIEEFEGTLNLNSQEHNPLKNLRAKFQPKIAVKDRYYPSKKVNFFAANNNIFCLLEAEEKELKKDYARSKEFYDRMKASGCFKDTKNFSNLSDEQSQKIHMVSRTETYVGLHEFASELPHAELHGEPDALKYIGQMFWALQNKENKIEQAKNVTASLN